MAVWGSRCSRVQKVSPTSDTQLEQNKEESKHFLKGSKGRFIQCRCSSFSFASLPRLSSYVSRLEAMALSSAEITSCLFFSNEALEAAKFYVSIFPNSTKDNTAYFPGESQHMHKQPAGTRHGGSLQPV